MQLSAIQFFKNFHKLYGAFDLQICLCCLQTVCFETRLCKECNGLCSTGENSKSRLNGITQTVSSGFI